MGGPIPLSLGRFGWAVAKRVLPAPLLYEAWFRATAGDRRTALPTAADVQPFEVQPGVEVAAYWSTVPGVGTGPSASVYVHDEEVLRIDVFGNEHGHMHLNPGQIRLQRATVRFAFPPEPLDRQMARGLFELRCNTPAAAAHNLRRRVRSCALDHAALAATADAVGAYWHTLAARHAGAPAAAAD
jgi:hypothetical protein